jgi:S1-C subfamily serine protease
MDFLPLMRASCRSALRARIAAAWLLVIIAGPNPAVANDLAGTVQMIKSSIVGIGTYSALRRPPMGLIGTGFAVLDGQYIVTNYHVIPKMLDSADKEHLVIVVGEGAGQFTEREAKVVMLDAAHDLALLKMSGKPLQALKLGGGALLLDGTEIAITGFPIGNILGIYPVTHRGIVSAITPVRVPQVDSRLLDANMIMREPFDVYQLDITSFPGNSGSPVYNSTTGEVEAILNSTFIKETKERALSEPSGISFAIPVIYIHLLLKKAGLEE